MPEPTVKLEVEPAIAVIQVELESLYVLPEPKKVQPSNGMAYIGKAQAGRRIKAVIFEDGD